MKVVVTKPNQTLRLGTVVSNTLSTVNIALEAFAAANSAFNVANQALATAILAASNNAVLNVAKAAYQQANLAYNTANSAYFLGNSSLTIANNASGLANIANAIAVSANAEANLAYGRSNSAIATANASITTANISLNIANQALVIANATNLTVNLAYSLANTLNNNYQNVNTTLGTYNNILTTLDGLIITNQQNIAIIYNVANNGLSTAQTATSLAIAANVYAQTLSNNLVVVNNYITTVNSYVTTAYSTTYAAANAANVTAQSALAQFATVNTEIQAAISGIANIANNAANNASLAYSQGSGAYIQANIAIDTANSAVNIAELAFTEANNAINVASNVTTTITSQSLVASVNQNTFSLNFAANGEAYVFVTKNGLLQIPTVDYTLSGNILTLTSPAFGGDVIETRFFRALTVGSLGNVAIGTAYDQANLAFNQSNVAIALANAVGALYSNVVSISVNTNTIFLPANTGSPNNVLVVKNGLIQLPFTDYNLINANQIVLTSNAVAGDIVEARLLGSGAVVYGNSANGVISSGVEQYVYANGGQIVANSSILNFNNTATINVAVTQSGFSQANVAFSVNTSAIGSSSSANAYNQANSAYNQANAAFVLANNALPLSGGTITGNLSVTNIVSTNTINVGPSQIFTNIVVTSANNTAVTIDSFPTSAFTTAKYVVQISTSTGIQAEEMFLIQDGVNVYVTDYGSLASNGILGIVSSNIVSTTLNLNITPINPNSLLYTIKVMRTTIAT